MYKIKNILSQSDFVTKVLKGTFWLSIGSVASKVLVAFAYIILARILPPEEYGEYGMLKSTIDNFLIFASLGIGLTTTKYISENKNSNPQLASGILGTSLMMVLITGLLVGGIIFLFSDTIAITMLQSVKLKPLLGIVAIILVITSFNGVQLGALLGLQSFKQTSIANILQGVLLFLGITTGGYLDGVKGAIIGNLLALVLLSISIQILLKTDARKLGISYSVKNWKQDIKTIYKFAIPASLSTLITAPTIWFLNAMLVRGENGYFQLGIYSAVVVITSAIQMLNGSLSNVLLPIFLSKETKITPKKEFFNYFGSWILAIIIGMPIIVFPELVSFIIGDKYPKEIVLPVLVLAVVSTLIISNKQGVSRDLIIKNKMWLSVYSMGQWAIMAVVLFVFLRKYGAVGFALSFAISYVFNLVLFTPFFIKKKIVPKYLFYNKNVVAIWFFLLSLIAINYYGNTLLRISISIILIYFLIVVFTRLFQDVVVAEKY